jgi:hypothetical protein
MATPCPSGREVLDLELELKEQNIGKTLRVDPSSKQAIPHPQVLLSGA